MNCTALAEALVEMGFFLGECVDQGEVAEYLETHDGDVGPYTLVGQTDNETTYVVETNDPERAEVVFCVAGMAATRSVVQLLRALGWQEIPDNYVNSSAFYLPEA